jgi:phosphoribosylformimino-5-aminoimidazole carboxamide ribotide isomerase
MRVIPVLDLKNGVVVRGVGGRRAEYQPVVSRLTNSCQPQDVALTFRDVFGAKQLYLADLDAIAGAEPAWSVFTALHDLGFALWVDSGVREMAAARRLAAAGVKGIVVGLETVSSPEELERICSELCDRVIFSLDMKANVPLGDSSRWGGDALLCAERALAAGVRRMIVLDLARVGEGGGPGTEDLCRAISENHPTVELIAGGGVRGNEDLRRLEACGVRAALVASALHDGRLGREDFVT